MACKRSTAGQRTLDASDVPAGVALAAVILGEPFLRTDAPERMSVRARPRREEPVGGAP